MSYLVAFVCMFGVYLRAQKLELPGSGFALLTLLGTIILSGIGFLVPGVDALVACCVTMGLISAASWYLEKQFMAAVEAGDVEITEPVQPLVFCSRRTHDFIIGGGENDPVRQINDEQWPSLLAGLNGLSAVQRQGFYANLNYAEVSELAVLNFVNNYPDCVDAHVLSGHVKLCKAKRLGLTPSMLPDETTAQVVADAFKHFRRALRQDGADVEAMCGLILAKGFIALREDHLEDSLQKLLAAEPCHLHGMLAAACFLIRSPQSVNRFVSIVERSSAEYPWMAVLAKIVAHIECIDQISTTKIDNRVVADLYRQLKIYKKECDGLSHWQRGIANNIVAYAFEKIGDIEEKNRILQEIDGVFSLYPWRRDHASEVRSVATMGYLAG